MFNLTWKVFCMTGNIDTYLLMKEIERIKEEDNHYLLDVVETEKDEKLH